MTTFRSNVLIFLLLTIISGAMRFYCLGEWSFDLDELFTVLETKILFNEMSVPEEYLKDGTVKAEETQLVRLPQMIFVSYFIHWVDYKLFGENEFGTRVLTAVLGTLSIGVIFLMSRPILGFVGALVLSLLVMFLPEHILSSQCNRFYIQSFFMISVVLLLGYYVVIYRLLLLVFLLGLLAVVMIFTHSLSGLIWGGIAGGIVLDTIRSRIKGDKKIPPVREKYTIIIIILWSILILAIAIFYLMPLAAAWNKSLSWGYSPLHSVLSFINVIGWQFFLFSILGICFSIFRVADSGSVYWLFCVLVCGISIVILPLMIIYNPNYNILFVFPFIVTASLFIQDIYFLILRSALPCRYILAVSWISACVMLNLPSVVSYYQDGNRHDNRAAFAYVSDNWKEGDRLTGFTMGTAEYYIPTRVPRIPLHIVPDKAIEDLQNIIDNNHNNTGRLWIVLQSSRGGLDNNLRKWLGKHAKFECRFTKKRFDYIENNVEIFLIDQQL
ncbi:MAG: glycosyltransferase family 39 protein [Planctomycetaceae bacterium]|jgi:hypothetical protein|nr:glycosyltransferase family 39 protein [Planctomycetaceae bacterium]